MKQEGQVWNRHCIHIDCRQKTTPTFITVWAWTESSLQWLNPEPVEETSHLWWIRTRETPSECLGQRNRWTTPERKQSRPQRWWLCAWNGESWHSPADLEHGTEHTNFSFWCWFNTQWHRMRNKTSVGLSPTCNTQFMCWPHSEMSSDQFLCLCSTSYVFMCNRLKEKQKGLLVNVDTNSTDADFLWSVFNLFGILWTKIAPWSSRWFEEILFALIWLALIWLALIWLALIWLALI